MDYLHVDSITKNYASKTVLSNLFIACHTGSIIGLLGRNGTGKSTLLKIIFGSEKADFKFQKINNTIIRKTHRWISYLPQDNFLPKKIKIKTLISLFCEKNSVKELYDNEFIAPYLHCYSNELSGGEKRIIEILMILNTSAKFILLDEPFNGVSPINKKEIIKMIRKKSTTKGVILTDHDYHSILEVATEIKLLHNSALFDIRQVDQLAEYGYIYSN